MIREFAIDPEAISDWQNFRFINSHFGMDQGRLISRFPSKWKKAVFKACEDCLPIEKSRIVEQLQRIETKLFAAGREYDSNKKWIENAKTSHREQSFQAVITTSDQAIGGSFLDIEKLDDSDPKWNVSTGVAIPRNAVDMCAAAKVLLNCSAEIIFVDQHFSFTARHGKPLTAFLKQAFAGCPVKRLQYHLNAGDKSGDWFSGKLDKWRYHLELPDDASIVFVRWQTLDGGENLHPRYILTERGGLQYDYGLDEGQEGETSNVHLLSAELHAERWSQFQPGSGVFTMVDAWAVTANSVTEVDYRNEAFQAKQ